MLILVNSCFHHANVNPKMFSIYFTEGGIPFISCHKRGKSMKKLGNRGLRYLLFLFLIPHSQHTDSIDCGVFNFRRIYLKKMSKRF